MHSQYLDKLSAEQHTALCKKLLEQQGGKCFICGEPLDLDVQHQRSGEIERWLGRIFSGKKNADFWKHIFKTGMTPDGVNAITKPLNTVEMIQA